MMNTPGGELRTQSVSQGAAELSCSPGSPGTGSALGPHDDSFKSKLAIPEREIGFNGNRTSALVAVSVVCGIAALYLFHEVHTLTNREIFLFVLCVGLVILTIAAPTFGLPYLLRPMTLIALGSAAGTFAGVGLAESADMDFLALRGTEAAGILAGALIGPLMCRNVKVPLTVSPHISRTCVAIYFFGVGSALIFFAARGIPVLGTDIESGRVEAAASGTGYLRVAAYMTIPAALTMFALRQRYSVWAVIGSLLIVLGMANRSPILYLLIPIGLMVVVVSRDLRKSARVVTAAVILVVIAIISLGTYRIVSESEFKNYDEYAELLRDGDYLGIAQTSVEHYVAVVVDNGRLTKRLVDNGAINHKYGASYASLAVTALPGTQLTLDREIKVKSGSSFVGGGTPPTLAGEGYVNFGFLGTFLVPMAAVVLLTRWAYQLRLRMRYDSDQVSRPVLRLLGVRYGYLVVFCCGAQVAGFAGASPVPLAGFVLLVLFGQLQFSRESL